MTLPFYAKTLSGKLWCFLAGSVCTIFLYQLTNRLQLAAPRLLELGPVDRSMPLLPWTVWVYFSEYIIFFCAYFGLKDNENVMRYFYTYMIVFVISIACFIVFPVTFPRDQFPDAGVGVSDQALYFLRNYMDTPKNCLPSLHVSTCFVSAFCFWRESKKKTLLFSLWALAVAISTMTTKQHYFVDVWTALILTLSVNYYCFNKLKLS